MSTANRVEGVERLNTLPLEELAAELEACCGSRRWVREVLARRPFRDRDALLAAVDAAWRMLDGAEWRIAHEAVGDQVVPQTDDGTRAAIDVALDLYRERFGHRCIVAHEDLTAEELLMRIRIRLGHEVLAETRKSRAEQRQITRRRLERLLDRGTAE
jgi:2-oxo-4-hydroxy-4-carboxy-5-ureidoimidazoline decarboxylase